jgi:hypothetical protein
VKKLETKRPLLLTTQMVRDLRPDDLGKVVGGADIRSHAILSTNHNAKRLVAR